MTTNYNQNPFKKFLQVIVVMFFAIALSFIVWGCASKPIEATHTIERIIEHKTDSSKITQVNKAILDSLVIKIAKVKTAKPECDSITQATLDQVLRQLNMYKKAGNNEASIGYDEILKEIVVLLKQGETKDEVITTNKLEKDKEKDKEVKPVFIRYIPWWVKFLAWIGGGFLAYIVWRIARIFILK